MMHLNKPKTAGITLDKGYFWEEDNIASITIERAEEKKL